MYACNSTKTPSANATEKTIAGINWNLKKIHSSSGVVVINNPNAFIKFDAEKNSAGGKGGCNSFGSNYNINNASINFKNVFSTKMFCEKFQKEEDEFFKQLEKVNRYDVVDGKLFLYQDNELLLEFDK
jgi:heat shock protein HslJ